MHGRQRQRGAYVQERLRDPREFDAEFGAELGAEFTAAFDAEFGAVIWKVLRISVMVMPMVESVD